MVCVILMERMEQKTWKKWNCLVTWSTISPKTKLPPSKHSTNKQFHKNGLAKMYLSTQTHKFIMDIVTKNFF
jgi:hypothetical protein